MKIFKDLIFIKDKTLPKPKSQAIMNFDNDYGVSVITGYGAYGNVNSPYEIAVLYKGEITYDTPIASDVIGYLKSKQIDRIMKNIQKLT